MARTKTVKTKVKKGDIVFLNGWDGVIGRVVSYDRKGTRLTLEWPETAKTLARYGGSGTQEFYPVVESQITVLTVNELFERIPPIVTKALEQQKKSINCFIDGAGLQVF